LKFIIDTFNSPMEYAEPCAMQDEKMKMFYTFERINDSEALIKVDIKIKDAVT
jgi:hypothetical protein